VAEHLHQPEAAAPQPFVPNPLAPGAARLLNVLCTRSQPWPVTVGLAACRLSVPVLPPDAPAPEYGLRVRCGAHVLRLDVGPGLPLGLHPALAQADASAALPEEVRLAVVELLAAPLAEALGRFLGTSVTCEALAGDRDAEAAQPTGDLPCRVGLLLEVPGDDGGYAPVPLTLHLSDAASAMLAEQCLRLPQRHEPRDHLPVCTVVEAGRMCLAAAELADLAPGDILLPDDYPAHRGRLTLAVTDSAGTAPAQALALPPALVVSVPCAVADGRATVLDIVRNDATPMETTMSDTTPTPQPDGTPAADAAPDAAGSAAAVAAPEAVVTAAAAAVPIDVNALGVTVVFELERRPMTVGDLAALAPGYTFALGADPLGPVTLTVGGRAVGTGRLVDLGGTLGVQVLRMGQAGEGDRP
jgi:type III secretion protein Q